MEATLNAGGTVVIEWPTSCSYWRCRSVKAFINAHKLGIVKINGCAFDLRNSKGALVYKPWTLCSSSAILLNGMTEYRCSRDHQHEELHGRETARSSYYPIKTVRKVHSLFLKSLSSQGRNR